MQRTLDEGVLQIRNGVVNFYLLHDEAGLYLIDSGFVLGRKRLVQALGSLGRPITEIKTVLVTHGHLDHVANLHWIKERSGASILGFASEEAHIRGAFPYRGASRICGWLEAVGRVLLRYQPAGLDAKLADGEIVDAWGGLEVVHLPGHTGGHCGFFSRRTGLLFGGDLFVNRSLWTKLPPLVLNSCPEHFPSSLRRVFELSPSGILTNHCDRASAELQLERFRRRFGNFDPAVPDRPSQSPRTRTPG